MRGIGYAREITGNAINLHSPKWCFVRPARTVHMRYPLKDKLESVYEASIDPSVAHRYSPGEAIMCQERYVGLDVHKRHVVVAAVDADQRIQWRPKKIAINRFWRWAESHLNGDDRIALEATSGAWPYHDRLREISVNVVVANAHKVQLIASSRVKTDRHDALVLAKLLAANLLPTVWVPPPCVRELRGLTAHRRRLVRERTAAKNRLHGVLQRHNLLPPPGRIDSQAQADWWSSVKLSSAEMLRVRHELMQVEQLSAMIDEVESEVAQLSIKEPWIEHVAYLLQLPGVGLNSAMTILAAIGDITRFAKAGALIGYAGLGASVHASGNTYRTGGITKQGRRELRTVLVECAWMAVRYGPVWKAMYQRLKQRMPKPKAITVVARKLLVAIWHILSKHELDRYADPQAIARSPMTWATNHRVASSLGLTRPAFVKRELARLGIADQVKKMHYGSKVYNIEHLWRYPVRQTTNP
jgi:transposase